MNAQFLVSQFELARDQRRLFRVRLTNGEVLRLLVQDWETEVQPDTNVWLSAYPLALGELTHGSTTAVDFHLSDFETIELDERIDPNTWCSIYNGNARELETTPFDGPRRF